MVTPFSQSKISYQRLLPRLQKVFAEHLHTAAWQMYERRLRQHFPALFELLLAVYGERYDFFYHLENILFTTAHSWFDRPSELKALDSEREANPSWFQTQQMLGGVLYTDLFADTLSGVQTQLPYFQELGLTYLHLMPLFKVPEPENDGGYAVSSYREVRPSLGNMRQLQILATELRQQGISLVLDFIFNHTSNEHEWAQRALAGDLEYSGYYFLFPDRTMPDAYDSSLREIFPDQRRGSFTYLPKTRQWVWTTFHSYQWDLNYANPAVLNSMAQEMLFLANLGVEVLRLDAVAFIWKQIGTTCENLPQAHQIIRIFNLLARIAAPALYFKSEAIVHPDDVVKYISSAECQISYNPLVMALLWESLATRRVELLQQALQKRYALPTGTAWVNYVRCHDDIGWTFSDEDAALLGINGYHHRRFLNLYYTGRFEGSFACGLPFQENPATGDCRISGTCASLAGIEHAIQTQSELDLELGIRRVLLLYGMILSLGGIPLLYLGDEIGTLNDYTYRLSPSKAHDSRWVHRPKLAAKQYEARLDNTVVAGQIYTRLHRLIQLRKKTNAFAGNEIQILPTQNDHVLGYLRQNASQRILVLVNFSHEPQPVDAHLLRLYGLSYNLLDLVTDQTYSPNNALVLDSYQMLWLLPN